VKKLNKSLIVIVALVFSLFVSCASINRYPNNGSLTNDYFTLAYETLDDPFIYLVISDTGSPTSVFLSIFTKTKYNHISLSFDRNLATMISYNGGEHISPPGLNKEQIQQFNKKEDASLIVYKLSCTKEQKEKILENIQRINQEGSNYSLIGYITKKSSKSKPNTMFCSQFVYTILKAVNLDYFKKPETSTKPVDFIERDYYRKLQYDYEIRLKDVVKK
jgi:hypothetical protein